MKQAKAGGVDEEGEPVEPEGADLLALFFSDQEDAEEDRWLNEVISAVAEAGFPVYALNDGMQLLEPETDTPAEEGEEDEDEVPEPADAVTYSRKQLEVMDLDDLKKIATDKNITVAPRSRRPTYIDAILGEKDEVPEVEMEELPTLKALPVTTSTGASMAGNAQSSQPLRSVGRR